MAPRKQARSSKQRTRSRTRADASGKQRTGGAKRKAARRAKPKPARRAKPKPALRAKPKSALRAKPKSALRAKPKPAPPAAPPARDRLGLERHHIEYTTHVMDEVRRFYTEVLKLGAHVFDPRSGRLTVETGAGSSLGFVPPMPGPPEQWRPPREPAICLVVRDVDRAYRELSGQGVVFVQEPAEMPGGQRVAILRDPEGRTVMLANTLPR